MNETAAATLSVDYLVKNEEHVPVFEEAITNYLAESSAKQAATFRIESHEAYTFVEVKKQVEEPSASYAEFEHEADLMHEGIGRQVSLLGFGALAAQYHSGTMISGPRLPERE
jgi:hypothetical protein